MFDRILLPTDGSEGAERAAGHARTYARTFGATVHVVSVVDVRQYSSTSDELDDVGRKQRDRLREEAEDAVATAEDALGDEVAVVTDILQGIPHESILDYAADSDADLLVMGTHGRTGLQRLLVGSTTERVARLADRPVLTVGPDADPADGVRNVLVPTDGSAGVEPAVAAGLDAAEAFGATVHALYVADVRTFFTDDADATPPDPALDLLEDRGEKATDAVAERATERGLDAETGVVDGVPTSAIVDYAADREMDLVVMGTHGRTGIDRLLLGSVAEGVIRQADCPVLTVRRSDGEQTRE
jgi:nucleotide-binding universal stress UspA family protein